jgi:hypothetical protein
VTGPIVLGAALVAVSLLSLVFCIGLEVGRHQVRRNPYLFLVPSDRHALLRRATAGPAVLGGGDRCRLTHPAPRPYRKPPWAPAGEVKAAPPLWRVTPYGPT